MTRPVTVRPRVPTVPCPLDPDWPIIVNPRAHSPDPWLRGGSQGAFPTQPVSWLLPWRGPSLTASRIGTANQAPRFSARN